MTIEIKMMADSGSGDCRARGAGIAAAGGSDNYLRTKKDRMGHLLEMV
jgi:hypothetical protein